MPDRIADLDDPRLDDYRQLKDAAARRLIEGDELFVAEGPVAIDRMIASGHRLRSALILDRKYERLAPMLADVDAPVYVVDEGVMVSGVRQRPFLLRAIYFLLIGWWFSGLWMAVAYVLLLSIVGMPAAFWMYGRIGAVTTLFRS